MKRTNFVIELFYCLVYVSGVCSNTTDVWRQFNGHMTVIKIEDAPFVVSVGGMKGRTLTSGSIVSRKWVLTVAHVFHDEYGKLVEDDRSVVVHAGTSSEEYLGSDSRTRQSFRRRMIQINPGYITTKRSFGKNDLGLVMIDGDFKWTEYVQKINFMGKSKSNREIVCNGFGYGMINKNKEVSEDTLLKKYTWLIKRHTPCRPELEDYVSKDGRIDTWLYLWPREGVGICPGDSGGPVICDDRLTAVISGFVSFEVFEKCSLKPTPRSEECGTSMSLGIMLEICTFGKWMREWALRYETDEYPIYNDGDDCIFAPSCSKKPIVSFICVVLITIIL